MEAAKWIKAAQKANWRVQSSQKGTLRLCCAAHGCKGSVTRSLSDLGPIPAPCDRDHSGLYAQPVFDEYRAFVAELARRRRQIGLSQEDLGAAAGLADGHINKLEAFARTAQFPTLQLWANTLGMKVSLAPAPIPAATLRAIEGRKAHLMQKQTVPRLPAPDAENPCDARPNAS